MSDKNSEADFLISSVESKMALFNLAQRGEYASGVALLAGDVLKTALASGVPHHLAEEMATDFWKAEMLTDTVAALVRTSDLDEEGEG